MKKKWEFTFGITLLLFLLFFLFFPGMLFSQPQKFLPEDSSGWSLFTPSSDSRILYVSSSEGNDATAAAYLPSDAEIGNDPFLPTGNILAYATINAALADSREDFPDWILLKRGDEWYEPLSLKNGRSGDEPFLVGAYGADFQRPLLKTGAETGVNQCCHAYHDIVVTGIHFYAHTRDPNSGEYSGPEGNTGFNLYVNADEDGTNVLIEDCLFRFYTNNVVQGPGNITNIIIRRNLILDNYSSSAHSQGMYTNNIRSMLLEENIFDHNGWLIQSVNSDNAQDSGQATIYNHNTYFANGHNITFRENIFLRASSIGNKWTANNGEASSSNIVIDNNLYVEGEIGVSMGGNEAEPPYRFKNIKITNNVMLDMGRGRPTNRSLGWYLEMNDWDGGTVSRNLFAHQVSSEVTNSYAINMIGETRNVFINENIFHGIRSNGFLVRFSEGSTKENINFTGNALQSPGLNARLVQANADISNHNFSNNSYFSERAESEWFQIGGTNMDLAAWSGAAGETSSQITPIDYPDAGRSIEAFHLSLGFSADFEAFISEIRSQSRLNWRPEFTAGYINDWLRAGYNLEKTNIQKNLLKLRKTQNINELKMYSINGKVILSGESPSPLIQQGHIFIFP